MKRAKCELRLYRVAIRYRLLRHEPNAAARCGRTPPWLLAVAAAVAAARARLLDLRAFRRDGVPLAAEGVGFLTLRQPGLCVLHEPVERVLVVGHLQATIRATGRAEQRRLHAAAGLRLARCDEGRPEGRTPSGAGALAALVLLEHVERPTLGVDENRAEARLPNLYDRGARLRAERRGRESERHDQAESDGRGGVVTAANWPMRWSAHSSLSLIEEVPSALPTCAAASSDVSSRSDSCSTSSRRPPEPGCLVAECGNHDTRLGVRCCLVRTTSDDVNLKSVPGTGCPKDDFAKTDVAAVAEAAARQCGSRITVGLRPS